ncbi:MAG: chromosomal replication initiator protein DnaA [Solirubrobacterales bacterium]
MVGALHLEGRPEVAAVGGSPGGLEASQYTDPARPGNFSSRVAASPQAIPGRAHRARLTSPGAGTNSAPSTSKGEAVSEHESDRADGELAGAWQGIREDLHRSLPESTFRIWLDPLRVVAARGATLYLTAPPKVRTWVERRYSAMLDRAAQAGGQFDQVRFLDQDTDNTGAPPGGRPLQLNPEYSFERFVIGPGSRIAHAAALAVAEAPGQAYNPLFLHGPPGLGKTHLLGAIANYLRGRNPQLAVHYTTAEEFTNGFVAALQGGEIDAFKAGYRGVDVLLLDDVQFLEGKARTADELFHTFNALYESGAQVVLSADRMPSELSDLADRLRDRFDWGLVAELRAPDELTRVTFLNRLRHEGEAGEADTETLDQIARRVTDNLRLLRGALTRVVAFSSMTGSPITRGLLDEALPGSCSTFRAGPTAAQIQEAVCAHAEIERTTLLSQSRAGPLIEARQLAMYLTRQLTDLSLPQIARAFKRRDHTTVLHALRRIEARLDAEPSLGETVVELSSALDPAGAGTTPVDRHH